MPPEPRALRHRQGVAAGGACVAGAVVAGRRGAAGTASCRRAGAARRAARRALEHSQPADSDVAEQVAVVEPFGCGGNEVVEQDVALLEFGYGGDALDAGEVLRRR